MKTEKLHLVIADDDQEMIRNIEEEFVRTFSDRAELHFITDPVYMGAFFRNDPEVDVLIVSQSMYGDFLQDKKIRHLFLVIPEIGVETDLPEGSTVIVKCMPKEEILPKIEAALEEQVPEEEDGVSPAPEREPQVVGVFSPVGGCGKSMTALAIARKLKKLDQKVLVIGCDPMQSISAFLPQNRHADEELAELLRTPGEDTYWQILQSIEVDEISYLLPFEKALPFLQIGMKEWKALVDVLKEKKDFDFLILDLGSVFSPQMTEILNDARALVLITEPGEIANRKVQKLLGNADMLPKCECMMIANEYHADAQHGGTGGLFGRIAPYTSWAEAIEDPLFYRIALELLDKDEPKPQEE